VRFASIAAEKAEFRVVESCQALRVSTSGFYVWQVRPESPRAIRDRQLLVQIRTSYARSRGRRGRPRVWKDLHEAGEYVSEKRGARLTRRRASARGHGKLPFDDDE
jgi:hypothetical protein